jgi:YfiH family protein
MKLDGEPQHACIVPAWPAASRVKALFSTRLGGVSKPPYDTLNMGDHVGDVAQRVEENRRILAITTGAKPVFLKQVHGFDLVDISLKTSKGVVADACWTQEAGVACTIMVADCLPILMTDSQGRWVAAVHAGWRGLAGQKGRGVLEVAIERCLRANGGQAPSGAADLLVWLGPCIGPEAFEVGPEVRAAFCADYPSDASAFQPTSKGSYLANLAQLARFRLKRLGVAAVYGNDSASVWCTYTQQSRFFSHRRDAAVWGNTGRMAACIWLDS